MSSREMEGELLQAARLLKSSPHTTMDRLAEHLGVSRATLYRRHGGRAGLLKLLDEGVPADDTRTRILRAAAEVLGSHGLLGSTMEQIAQQAGVGVATVYRQFGDKEALVGAVVEELTPRGVLRTLEQAPTDDLRGELTALVRAGLEGLAQTGGLIRLSLFGSDAERAYLERVRHGTERALELLARSLRRHQEAGRLSAGAEPQQLALALLGLLFAFGLIGPSRYGLGVTDPRQTAELIVGLFLDGAGGTA
ncbi:TetR family transcriptional regulator [Deinococcus koreensis]|nr:TetR family transcriptional regulator [Deinococcus koreensis]